ncbi:MAG TPA: sulfur reduction protein DsrE, partial [Nocardioides sp.]|nr:sulfur reduction protein DsrE [Nocardioides sp.]
MDSTATSLVLKVTCGTEALERLNQGFTVAATALASGADVSLWLTGDATLMAVPGRAEEVE